MAFKLTKRVSPALLKTAVIGNSAVIKVGDAIIPGATGHNTAVVTAANTSGLILGVVVNITGLNGKVLELESVTASASNETSKVYWVTYIPAYEDYEFTVPITAVAGTTTDSAGVGFFNMSTTANDAGRLQESSFTIWSGTAGQFVSFGPDPLDPTNLTVVGHFNKKI